MTTETTATTAPVIAPRCTTCGHACPQGRPCCECEGDRMQPGDKLCAHCARVEASRDALTAPVEARFAELGAQLLLLTEKLSELNARLAESDAKTGHLSTAVEKLTLATEPGAAQPASIDYAALAAEVAERLDVSDVASELSLSDVARDLDMSDLANELDYGELAGNLDLDEVVRHLDVKDALTETVERVVEAKVRHLVSEAVASALDEVLPRMLGRLRVVAE